LARITARIPIACRNAHLDAAWVKGKERVGITAGASAPEDLVQELIERLKEIDKVDDVSILPGVQENVHFRLPLSLTKAERRAKAAVGTN
jgi:hypothetical protein